jgi:hypothetical protein
LDIRHRSAAGDESRAAIDHGVVDGPRLVVARVVGADYPTADPVAQFRQLSKIGHERCSFIRRAAAPAAHLEQ